VFHLGLVLAVLFDRSLVDRHRVGQDVAVARITLGEIDPAVEPVQGIRRVDPHLVQRLVVGPVLDDHDDVGELVFERPGQAYERPLHDGFELLSSQSPRTRSTLMTSGTVRMADMMPWSWARSATSTTKLLIPLRSSVTVT